MLFPLGASEAEHVNGQLSFATPGPTVQVPHCARKMSGRARCLFRWTGVRFRWRPDSGGPAGVNRVHSPFSIFSLTAVEGLRA